MKMPEFLDRVVKIENEWRPCRDEADNNSNTRKGDGSLSPKRRTGNRRRPVLQACWGTLCPDATREKMPGVKLRPLLRRNRARRPSRSRGPRPSRTGSGLRSECCTANWCAGFECFCFATLISPSELYFSQFIQDDRT